VTDPAAGQPPAESIAVNEERGLAGVQEHPSGEAREDLRSNWRSADLAVAEKLQNEVATLLAKKQPALTPAR
jgi:hypothetical protein